MLPNINNAPKLTGNSSRLEILKALVDWIQKDEFAVGRKNKKNKLIEYNWSPMFPTAKGWGERIKQFSYAQATPVLAFKNIRSDIAPIIKNLSGLNPELGAMQTIAWGGLQKKHYDFSMARAVIAKSQGKEIQGNIPMNSGWTKVAALASMGGRNPTSAHQSIWDSRMSTSIIHRLDMLGTTPNIWENIAAKLEFSASYLTTSGRGGTRTGMRVFKNFKPKKNQLTTWSSHFWESQLVIEIAGILNTPQYKYPKMPYYDIQAKKIILRKWDVWGVGMVLFMDGY